MPLMPLMDLGQWTGPDTQTSLTAVATCCPISTLAMLAFNPTAIQANEHSAVSGGGRLGWFFPLKPNYDLELGISGQTGPWNNSGGQHWSADSCAMPLCTSAPISNLRANISIHGGRPPTWAPLRRGAGGSRGPTSWQALNQNLNLPFVNNLELVSRFDWVDDGLGTRTQRETAGYVYYLTNTLLLEGDYEWSHTRGPHAGSSNKWVFQLSYGF